MYHKDTRILLCNIPGRAMLYLNSLLLASSFNQVKHGLSKGHIQYNQFMVCKAARRASLIAPGRAAQSDKGGHFECRSVPLDLVEVTAEENDCCRDPNKHGGYQYAACQLYICAASEMRCLHARMQRHLRGDLRLDSSMLPAFICCAQPQAATYAAFAA